MNVHPGVIISLFDTADQTDYLFEDNTQKGKEMAQIIYSM